MEPEVQALVDRAQHLSTILPFATRAFVIEFAGTPKSGKSTAIEAISHLFKRNGFRVHVLRERASFCPIPMKGHLFFNMWCAGTMLAELLENIEAHADIIIKDRGLFDALVWLRLQSRRGEVTDAERQRIEDFLLLPRWSQLIDLVASFRVAPEMALAREDHLHISDQRGSVMSLAKLAVINEASQDAENLYGDRFRALLRIDTTSGTAKLIQISLATEILNALEEFLDPEILVVPRTKVDELPFADGGYFQPDAKEILTRVTIESGRYVRRSIAESDSDVVQIVPAAMLVHNERVLVLEREEKDPKSHLYGRATVWKGEHLTRAFAEKGTPAGWNLAIAERVGRSLFVSRQFPIDFLGYAWDRDVERSSRHLGVMHVLNIDSDDVANDLEAKEFRWGRSPKLFGHFWIPTELTSRQDEVALESWSRATLSHWVERCRS